MHGRTTLRNALQKRHYELPSVSNDMQSSETLRNSLGSNYKTAALNQLSYAGIPYTKAVFSGLIKRWSPPIFAHLAAKGIKVSRSFSTVSGVIYGSLGAGSS